MKKVMILALTGLMLTLTGCGAPKEVPDALVSNDIKHSFTNYNGIDLTGYDELEGTDIVINHNPDTKAHLDEVTADITVKYPYGTISYSADLVYQYDRGKDNWDRTGSTKSAPSYRIDPDKITGQYYYNDTSGYYGSTINEFLFSISTPEDLPGFFKVEGDHSQHSQYDGRMLRTTHFSDVFEISQLSTLDSYGGSFVTPLYNCLEVNSNGDYFLIVLTLTDGVHFEHSYGIGDFYLNDSTKVYNTVNQEQIEGWTDFGEDSGNPAD